MQKEPWNEIVNLKPVNLKILPSIFLQTAVPKNLTKEPPLPSWAQLKKGKMKVKRKFAVQPEALLAPLLIRWCWHFHYFLG